MIESMWSSMSSSMQLARDCLEREGGANTQNAPMEGLERFAQIIDNSKNFFNNIIEEIFSTFFFVIYSTK